MAKGALKVGSLVAGASGAGLGSGGRWKNDRGGSMNLKDGPRATMTADPKVLVASGRMSRHASLAPRGPSTENEYPVNEEQGEARNGASDPSAQTLTENEETQREIACGRVPPGEV